MPLDSWIFGEMMVLELQILGDITTCPAVLSLVILRNGFIIPISLTVICAVSYSLAFSMMLVAYLVSMTKKEQILMDEYCLLINPTSLHHEGLRS